MLQCWNCVVKHLEKTKEYHKRNGGVDVTMIQCSVDDITLLLQNFLVFKKQCNSSNVASISDTFEKDLLNVKNSFVVDAALVEENCDDKFKNASQLIVEITAYCQVNSDMIKASDRKFCSIVGWCLANINSGASSNIIVKFIHWLAKCLSMCDTAIDLFVANNHNGRILLALLVNVYFVQKEETIMNLEDHDQVKEIVNEVFMLIVDHALQSESTANFVQIVQSKIFQKTAKKLEKLKQEQRAKRLALVFQEAVLGCPIY